MEIVVAFLVGMVVLLASGLAYLWRSRNNGDALSKVSEQFLTLAEQRFARQAEAGTRELDTKKQLIDQQLANVNTRLEQVVALVRETETKREASFTQLTTNIKTIGQQAANLTNSTATLREALSNTRVRGQWGERMAEDVLRLLGFIEGVNYRRHETLEGPGSRPDFVFLLPRDLRLNMDVKFPYDNYIKFLEEGTEGERLQHKTAFLRDVRARIREVTTREYIDPEQGTVDYVLLFIPNESIYAFIHESDPGILDTAMQNKVICCSPFTLFAVLAVVRQAVDNFALQQDSEEIISLFGRFYNEWDKFKEGVNTLGRRLALTQKAYDQLTGPRTRMLERPLQRIEGLRLQKGLPVAEFSEDFELEANNSVEDELLPASVEPDLVDDERVSSAV